MAEILTPDDVMIQTQVIWHENLTKTIESINKWLLEAVADRDYVHEEFLDFEIEPLGPTERVELKAALTKAGYEIVDSTTDTWIIKLAPFLKLSGEEFEEYDEDDTDDGSTDSAEDEFSDAHSDEQIIITKKKK